MNEEQRIVQKQLRALEHAQKTGNVRKTCRYFGNGALGRMPPAMYIRKLKLESSSYELCT
jgi:hypothetical protein